MAGPKEDDVVNNNNGGRLVWCWFGLAGAGPVGLEFIR